MAFRFASLSIILIFFSSEIKSKVYERCELALELRDVYEFSLEELSTWVCIANYESHYNTSAHNPGSGDHGLFQISELFWCSPNEDLACAVKCTDLKDDDIENDVICAKRIFRQHKRISGNGFTAWVVYNLYCNNRAHADTFLKGCFTKSNLKYQKEKIEEQTTRRQNLNLISVTTHKPTKVPSTTIDSKDRSPRVFDKSRITSKESETSFSRSIAIFDDLFLKKFPTTHKVSSMTVTEKPISTNVPITTSKSKERQTTTTITNKPIYSLSDFLANRGSSTPKSTDHAHYTTHKESPIIVTNKPISTKVPITTSKPKYSLTNFLGNRVSSTPKTTVQAHYTTHKESPIVVTNKPISTTKVPITTSKPKERQTTTTTSKPKYSLTNFFGNKVSSTPKTTAQARYTTYKESPIIVTNKPISTNVPVATSKPKYSLTNFLGNKVSSTSNITSNSFYTIHKGNPMYVTNKPILANLAKVATTTIKPREKQSTTITNKFKYTTPNFLFPIKISSTSKATSKESETGKFPSFSSPKSNNLFFEKFSTPKIEQRTGEKSLTLDGKKEKSRYTLSSFIFKNGENSDKSVNVKPRETKYSSFGKNSMKLKNNERLYSFVDKPDYTYQITSHGFSFSRSV